MRLDRPSSGGGDKPPPRPNEGNHGTGSQDAHHKRPEDTRDGGEGTGWPKDQPKTPEVPKSPEERARALEARNRALESENKSLRSENKRMELDYTVALQELKRTRDDHDVTKMWLEDTKRELGDTKRDRSRLIDTNAALVRDNMALRKKTESSSAFDRNANATGTQGERVEQKTRRKNWFPTDAMGRFGGSVASAAGAYAVMTGSAGSKEEAFGLACTGVGLATLSLARDVTDRINAWRDKRAEKKNADR